RFRCDQRRSTRGEVVDDLPDRQDDPIGVRGSDPRVDGSVVAYRNNVRNRTRDAWRHRRVDVDVEKAELFDQNSSTEKTKPAAPAGAPVFVPCTVTTSPGFTSAV